MKHTKKMILIVDDNPQNIQVAANILHSEDTELAFAQNGKEAIERLKKADFDLILMDVMMPEMDGFEAARHIKQIEGYKHVPIIFVTAKNAKEDIVEGFYSGGADYVTKPFHPKELLARVQTHLVLKNYRDHLEEQIRQEVAARMQAEKEKHFQEQMLIQQNKMAEMGEMIAAITHQIRQPVTAIFTLAQNVIDLRQSNEMTDSELFSHMNQVIERAGYMNQTVNDFRNFFMPHKNKVHFSPIQCAFEVNKLMAHQFMSDHINVMINGDETLIVHGVKNELTHVFLNLFKNAREMFAEKEIQHGLIRVSVEKQEDSAVIKIQDNGGGILDDLLPDKLFEPYVSTKGNQGTGIGLRICKKIIQESFDGSIAVHNIKGGAEFEIKLPLEK